MKEGWWKLKFSVTKAQEVALGYVTAIAVGQKASSVLLHEGQGASLVLKEKRWKISVMGGIMFPNTVNVENVVSLFIFKLTIKVFWRNFVISSFYLYILSLEFVPMDSHRELELASCQARSFNFYLQHT